MRGLPYRSLAILTVISSMLLSCHSYKSSEGNASGTDPGALADLMEISLQKYIISIWYPRNIDSLHGGYISFFNSDWSRSEGSQDKALVQQARHLWTTAYIYELYPEQRAFLDYAEHGYHYLRDVLWDTVYGGYFFACSEAGLPLNESINDKRIYGQAFALHGLSKYYKVSKDQEALELAKHTFFWMEEHAHDPVHGGYFEFLTREGDPVLPKVEKDASEPYQAPSIGLKDYNSSIHIMESLTELYKVWPDQLVRKRLEEMFYLIRDVFVNEDGYLQCYFYPDWTLVPEEVMDELSGGNFYFTQHFTYGHDLETAFLLLESAQLLGLEADEKTRHITKKLVDHSLAEGWDKDKGGFYYAGRDQDGTTRITEDFKAWWTQSEGMNALLLMHTLYPKDSMDYYNKFVRQWTYIDTYLVDKEYGGWYNNGLDNDPGNRMQKKSHHWKASYHNTRAMAHCIKMLREMEKGQPL